MCSWLATLHSIDAALASTASPIPASVLAAEPSLTPSADEVQRVTFECPWTATGMRKPVLRPDCHIAGDMRLSTQNVSPTSRNSRSDCLVTHDACDPVAPQAQASPQRFQRVIRNAVGLRFLNIPNGMFRHLNLADMYSKGPHIGRRQNVCTVTLVIPSQGISHVVKMVRTTSNGQQHRRLSTGWRELCKLAKVSLGDKLTFTRDWHSKRLNVNIERGDQ